MPYDTERSESEPERISREVREEHRSVLLKHGDCQNSIKEFSQQDVINGLAEMYVLASFRRPRSMALRDMEATKGKLLANKVRQEIEAAERRIQFS